MSAPSRVNLTMSGTCSNCGIDQAFTLYDYEAANVPALGSARTNPCAMDKGYCPEVELTVVGITIPPFVAREESDYEDESFDDEDAS